MTERSRRTPLRTTIARIAIAVATVVVLGVSLLYVVTSRTVGQLSDATERFLEEQRTADRISQALVRQLVAASTGAARGDAEAREMFSRAGSDVYTLIQGYLFRTLSPSERLQLERVKRQHQHLEVSAVRAADLEARGQTAAAEAARSRMFEHASALLEEVETFIGMRQERLVRIRDQQVAIFRIFFLSTVLAALILLAGSLLAGRFLHRRVSLPLARLAEASGRIGSGDLEARVQPSHEDEFAAVGRSFNRMADNLASTQRRLEARNEELAAALDSLRTAQEELVQAEKTAALGRMIAGLAHELNNPLTSVLSHLQLLETDLREGSGPDRDQLRQEYVEPVLEEAGRARSLVLNLLHFARTPGSGQEHVSVRAALEVVVGLRRYAFHQEGLELIVGPVPEVHVRAERDQLQDIFMNIINNALEAMGNAGVEDGALRIHASARASSIQVVFDDEGPGFADPGRAFEPFYTTKDVGEGTGLGLALVHRFVQDAGGRITASRNPSGGARVVVELPVSEPPDGVEASAPGRDPSIPAVEAGRSRILVVEDETHVRVIQERLLRRLGAVPVPAASAAEARTILAREEVELVISDVRMPDETGLELYEWVEANHPELADRFLFVTGDIYNPDIRELAATRPELFIQKPFEMEEYLRRVTELRERGMRDDDSRDGA